MPMFKTCPHCGAHLDHGERCDCQDEAKDAPDAPGTPSAESSSDADTRVAHRVPNVNDCLRLREIMQRTGAMDKDAANVVQTVFKGFNRQLLSQTANWRKYGVIIHPDGLMAICEAYNVQLPPVPAAMSASVTPTRPPSGQTQCDRILRHFKDYGSITSLEAMQEYGIMRLASRISDLRRLGYAIRKSTETSKNRYGEPTSYARYSLEEAHDGTTA